MSAPILRLLLFAIAVPTPVPARVCQRGGANRFKQASGGRSDHGGEAFNNVVPAGRNLPHRHQPDVDVALIEPDGPFAKLGFGRPLASGAKPLHMAS
jgi:hypothetical protein